MITYSEEFSPLGEELEVIEERLSGQDKSLAVDPEQRIEQIRNLLASPSHQETEEGIE